MEQRNGRIVVSQTGGPEVMEWVDDSISDPTENEVQVSHEAIGVDFIDTQLRSGLLPLELPNGLGFSGVGRISAVGSGVRDFKVDDRVAYMYFVPGAYCVTRNVPADRVFKLPNQQLPATEAAGVLFRGLTAWYLARRLKNVEKSDIALVHTAAGGVGLLLVQWLKHLGATVIGTVGSENKVSVAKSAGCDAVVCLQNGDFAKVVSEMTDGKGVDIVYESIGKKTFDTSLSCIRRFGLMVSYGWPSGDLDNLSAAKFRNSGSLFFTRPTVTHYTAASEDFRTGADELFGLVEQGIIKVTVGTTYTLQEASRAHEDLASGRTIGSTVLTIS
ncbi:quinone oxidoreductase [Paraburkholderia sp. 22B1P]|uniref:quinone oxidoreductase family protein n=1 Tax=Paraburkholderia sp. 22B1P TaxID=3080498 RepID=UPI00308AE0AF|nr:quinone oxidoreductase [Paraburkholderia sp. 22B1P]